MFGRKRRALQAEVGTLRSAVETLETQLSQQHELRVDFERRLTQTTTASMQQVGEQSERAKATEFAVTNLEEVVNGMNGRIEEVSRSLTDQLGELGNQVDSLAETAVRPEALEPLQQAQVRLANEQARYEIAMRSELASLGEVIRRTRG